MAKKKIQSTSPPRPGSGRPAAAKGSPVVRGGAAEQKAAFLARTEQYLELGHDRLAAATFVAASAAEMGGPVLDVGTGKGLLAAALARRGLDVVSVDVSDEERPLAASLAGQDNLLQRISFQTADAAALPFPDGHFGACATMDVLHHLSDGSAILAEMVRVLKPGGLLLVADFDQRGFEIVARVHREEGREHPVGPVSLDWVEGFLAGCGMEKVRAAAGHEHSVAVYKRPEKSAGQDEGVRPGAAFAAMGREELLAALDTYCKSWLAHDGCWFLAAEERFGTSVAIDLDAKSWERFSVAEATRIMAAFKIPRGGGLASLAQVLERRMYAFINPQRIEWSPDRKLLRFHMESCRVQEARRRKNLPDFPCKPVGTVEFSGIARTVDPRIRVRVISCPPDAAGGGCSWEFFLEDDAEVKHG